MSKYRSIVADLADRIRAGTLLPGTRLPPQRRLAAELGVDLTTVTRAYTELKRMGLVDGRSGSGSYVRAEPPSSGDGRASFDLSMNVPPEPAGLGLQIAQGLAEVLAAPGGVLGYQPAGGTGRDRAAAAAWLGRRLGAVAPDRVLVAPGTQGALFAILGLLLRPGDTLACAGLTYPGAMAIAEHLGLRLVGLAQDKGGIDPAVFADLCRAAPPRALYLVPTITSPTTATLPRDRRDAIVAIARHHGVAIVEDDAYGALPEAPPPPLAALAPDLVWHVASLSKCAAPALRIAYVAAPDTAAAGRLTASLRAVTLMAPPMTAALASRWIADGTLASVTAAIRAENRARQQLAGAVLGGPGGGGATVHADPDGNHLWLGLPAGWTATGFAAAARDSGLLVVPADAFAVAGAGPVPAAVRLSLGGVPDRGALDLALRRLAGLLGGRGAGVTAIV